MSNLITDVRVFPVNHRTLKANASFTVSGAFVIKVKVVETQKGLMVQMPSRSYEKDGETKYDDQAFPVTADARKEMIDTVIAKYQETVGNPASNSNKTSNPQKSGDGLPF